MIFDLNHRIEAPTVQKATAVRETIANLLDQDEDVTLIQTGQSRVKTNWRVVGVDVTTKQPFHEDVEADTEQEAKAVVEGQGKTAKVVAEVRRAGG